MYVHKHGKGQAVCMYFGQSVYLSQIMYVQAMYVFKPDYLCSGEVYIMFKPDGMLAVIFVLEFSNQMA